ncbi:MAG: PQQ-binding-like beta-propeller repeat protein [Pirellulales bacterium]
MTGRARAEDWPTWRHDAARSAVSSEQLSEQLSLAWWRDLRPNHVAWSEDPRLQFDATYEPIVVGDTMVVASARTDSIVAIDAGTGRQKWQFFADGPIRFAPVAWHGKLYFGADDGRCYCIDVASGRLVWKFRAAQGERLVLGNERLISVWPVRGGLVIDGDRLRFTAGIWPFEGTRLVTVELDDTRQAKPTFTTRMLDDIAPQGYLATSEGKLFIPGGRGVARCIDLNADKKVPLQYGNQKETDYHLSVNGSLLFHGSQIYDLSARQKVAVIARRPVVVKNMVFCPGENAVLAYDLSRRETVTVKDRRGQDVVEHRAAVAWKLGLDEDPMHPITVALKAGNRLYCYRDKTLFAVDIPTGDQKPVVSWKTELDDVPGSLVVADGKLFAVTKNGRIHCFAGESPEKVATYPWAAAPTGRASDQAARDVANTLSDVKDLHGYCLVWGIGDGTLVDAILASSEMRVIAVDPDPAKVESLRRRAVDHYGTRVAVIEANPMDLAWPPYLAHLIVCGDPKVAGAEQAAFAGKLFQTLRPYGGQAVIDLDDDASERLAAALRQGNFANVNVVRTNGRMRVIREGALPGAADWTHEYGDSSNSLMSRDERVRAPLGVLWFGGPASRGELFYNRHFWGPGMTVVEGRMFLQGPGRLTAVDVYTGRIVWQVPIREGSGPGRRGNFFEVHKPGFHYVATKDSVYLVYPDVCLRIDPTSGKTLAELKLPSPSEQWGKVRVADDLLIATVFRNSKRFGLIPKSLVGIDRYHGEILWSHDATLSCPLTAVGGGKVYFYDGVLHDFYDAWRRKGLVPKAEPASYIKAIDLRTGEPVWEQPSDRVVTWLAHSEEHGVVIASNKKGIDARRAGTGETLWSKDEESPGFGGHPENVWDKVIVAGDQVIDQRGPGRAFDLMTGKPVMERDPLTGEEVPWRFTKTGHHCNYAIASPHLLTFRAHEAGFYDRTTHGTARLGGFRSGCRNSLIPADGVLNAPNFAYGCSCGFSIFTSLGLVHVPDVELWTYNAYKRPGDRLARVGINFGAPGDRLAADGTLWMEYPRRGDPSAEVDVEVQGDQLRWYRHAAREIAGDGPHWIGASGGEGLSKIVVRLSEPAVSAGTDAGSGTGTATEADTGPGNVAKEKSYTVRLFFAEPELLEEGARQFQVALQGKRVLDNWDILREAGRPRQLVIKEFRGIRSAGEFRIDLVAQQGQPVISGIEIVREGDE